jgi:hypothetical protein
VRIYIGWQSPCDSSGAPAVSGSLAKPYDWVYFPSDLELMADAALVNCKAMIDASDEVAAVSVLYKDFPGAKPVFVYKSDAKREAQFRTFCELKIATRVAKA